MADNEPPVFEEKVPVFVCGDEETEEEEEEENVVDLETSIDDEEVFTSPVDKIDEVIQHSKTNSNISNGSSTETASNQSMTQANSKSSTTSSQTSVKKNEEATINVPSDNNKCNFIQNTKSDFLAT